MFPYPAFGNNRKGGTNTSFRLAVRPHLSTQQHGLCTYSMVPSRVRDQQSRLCLASGLQLQSDHQVYRLVQGELKSNLAYWRDESFSFSDLASVNNGQNPGQHFFYTPMVNMTNGTTDTYVIQWYVRIFHRCFANESETEEFYNPRTGYGKKGWQNAPDFELQYIEFGTAPGGQRPDIEATLNSCPALSAEDSAAIRLTDMETHYKDGRQCPTLEDITPVPCIFQSSAKELATNVSDMILVKMRCNVMRGTGKRSLGHAWTSSRRRRMRDQCRVRALSWAG
ncbi:hypothetical protein ONS95_003511 [Cadophora gregata]|uniref:uncharacterized protein n=1 Tax=Cadophora gregata TaxID=51156 RepID=UPI0026DCBD04|nr:uncharacterized protein ONS95_003511 [Cadophora gregata]KAK0106787.1 hypothetical protein ONS95_003511 [Cadophora gregata]